MRDILPVVVDGLWRQGAENLAVSLVSAEGQPLPAWTPGAHIDLPSSLRANPSVLPDRQPGQRDRYLLCIARESQSRGGSRYIHDTLRPGQPLMISAPRNHFPLHEGGHVVLLAAGIGITPLLAMAHARAASGASFTLHYYVSRAQEAAFATEIARQLTGGICQIHCSGRGAESAPAAGAGSGGSGRRHPGLLLRSARIYGPGSRYRTGGRMGGGAIAQRSVPAARPDGGVGGGRNLHHHPHLHRGALAGAGGQNHRPGAAGAWRRGAALLRDGDLAAPA